jgi:hypothetical protein
VGPGISVRVQAVEAFWDVIRLERRERARWMGIRHVYDGIHVRLWCRVS